MQTKLLFLFFALCWITGDGSLVNGKDTGCSFYYSKLLKKNVYTSVEIVPEFPGGEAAYQRFLNRNLRYPQEMIDREEWQSHVSWKFVVNTDGQIKCITFRDKVDPAEFNPLEKEVDRVIKLLPKWIPGKCNGKVVAVEVKRAMVVCPGRE